jgi:putative peptidoglycan binding protein/glycosyl hydrolase family 25
MRRWPRRRRTDPPGHGERLYDQARDGHLMPREEAAVSDPEGQPVMFRAGREDGQQPASAAAFEAAVTGPRVLLADISVWQPNIADAAYLAWSRAIIFRAMYGTSVDRAWYGGARRDALHAGGAMFVGAYQYLVAGQAADAQAHALVRLVGNLRPGEKLICDIEEGPASQQAARWRQWSAVITAAYGPRAMPWLYSGLSFGQAAGLSPHWVAAYRNNEPGGNHLLWQFTDAYPVPGVGTCDCSMFRGTIGELAALGWPATGPVPKPVPKPGPVPPPKPPPVPVPVTRLPVLSQGATGPAVRTLQALCTARGYPTAIDGTFGPGTKVQVMAVQRHFGLVPDGIVGPATWAALLGVLGGEQPGFAEDAQRLGTIRVRSDPHRCVPCAYPLR